MRNFVERRDVTGAISLKRYVFLVSVFFAAVLLYIPAYAAAYKDDMSDNSGNSVKQYHNLAEYSFSRMASSVPDATALSFLSAGKTSAWVTYRVNGASEATAGIYSLSGTFSAFNQKDSTHYLGIFQENMPSAARQQAFYSPSANAVYRDSAGSAQAYTDSVSYKFGSVSVRPPDALIGYGINFYYSGDGKSFTRISSVRHSKLQYSTASSMVSMFCYEEYTASVPSGAKYIRVEINDVTGLPHVNGGMVMKTAKAMTALASVTISGDALVMGEPVAESAPEELNRQPQTDPYFEPEIVIIIPKSAKEKEESEKYVLGQSEPAVKQESKSSSSSKFEGTITSPGSSKASPSSRPPSKSEAAASKSREAVSVPESMGTPEESIIYEIRRDNGGERLSRWVGGYIAIAVILLIIFMLVPKEK